MSTSLLYIHGFASCGTSNKVTTLAEHYGAGHVVSPDLPIAPYRVIEYLKQLIEQRHFTLLVGSSLGGYYAEYLGARYGIPAVLINPSTQPFDTLTDYVGMNTNWCTDEPFEWRADYLEQLRAVFRESPASNEQYLVLLQTGDELLDYRQAEQRYRQQRVIVEQGGNHRFENLQDYLPEIDRFIEETKTY